jgi:hypothetical protein
MYGMSITLSSIMPRSNTRSPVGPAVADLEADESLTPRAPDLSLQCEVPPEVIDIHHDAGTRAEVLAQVVRLYLEWRDEALPRT